MKAIRMSSLMLLLLLVAALASVSHAEEGVTLRLATWPGLLEITQKVAEAYNAQSNGITVEVESMGVGWDRFPEYLIPRLTSGTAPDIAFISPINYVDLYANGLIIDMMPYMQRDPLYDPSEYWPAVLQWAERDGAVYAFPAGMVSYVTYFNYQLFAEAGLPPLSMQHTQSELYELARALTQGEDQIGLGILTGLERIFPFVWANGGDMFSEDGRRALFNTPVWRDTVNQLVELIHGYGAAYPSALGGIGDMFIQGKLGILVDGTWAYRHFSSNLGDVLGITPLAEGSAGYNAPLWPDSYVITPGTEHPAEAWDAIRWFSTEGSRIFIFPPDGQSSIPIVRSIAEEFAHAAFTDPNAIQTYLYNAQFGTIPNYPLNYLNIMLDTDPVLREIFLGNVAPSAGLEQIQSRAEVLLLEPPF